jgi:LytS/YehU family sensor histidine kinase
MFEKRKGKWQSEQEVEEGERRIKKMGGVRKLKIQLSSHFFFNLRLGTRRRHKQRA